MENLADTKQCVICNKYMQPVFDKNWDYMQPYGGGEIKLLFSWGSLKFDHGPGVTVFNGVICDDCAEKLVKNMEKV